MFPISSHLRPTALACFSVLAFMSLSAAQDQPDGTSPASIAITIVDNADKPVAGASVEMRLWNGEWAKTKFKGKTDQEGKISFDAIPTDNYATILVKHPDFAPAMQDLTVTAGEQRKTTCKLLPPVNSWVEVRLPDGQAVEGAEITRLTIASPESESKTVVTGDMLPMLTDEAASEFQSDSSGRLKLPPVPAGSSVTVEVVHSRWAAVTTEEVAVLEGMIATTVLSPGTRIRLNLHGDPEAVAHLVGKKIAVRLFSPEIPGGRMIHHYPVENRAIEFCVPAGLYESMTLSADGVKITPELYGTIYTFDYTFDFLKLEGGFVEKNCVVRKTHEIRGRVVTAAGEPVAGTYVAFSVENLFEDERGERKSIENLPWVWTTFPQTDAAGYYTVKLPAGQAKIEMQSKDYYSDPREMQFSVSHEDSPPDYVVRPMPILKGVVLNSRQEPVSNAVIRLRSLGEPNYELTDVDGRFSIQLEFFDFDQNTKTRKLESTLIAFDPRSDEAQLAVVKVKDASEYEKIQLDLQPQKAEWIAKHSKLEIVAPVLSEEVRAQREKQMEKIRNEYQAGRSGNQAPEMTGGTWFNTEAQSLEYFRGQYVLLDFWFIGCGPCERDLPELKIAQELFTNQSFTILSVHISGQTPENVKQFADSKGMKYPLVVDSPSEEILNAYEQIGVNSFPSYILIGPDGKILHNENVYDPATEGGLSLHQHKLETIYQALRSANK